MAARLLQLLGARWMTAYLMLAYAVFLLMLAAWSALSPAPIIQGISRMIPFWLLYLLTGIHLLACTIQFIGSLRRRLTLKVPSEREGTPVALDLGDASLRATARQSGLRLRWIEEGKVAVLHRGRLAPLGTVLLHAALLLLPLAYVVSGATRFEGKAWIIEGHAFTGTRPEYYRVDPPDKFAQRAPRLRFDVEAVQATFWGHRLFFTDLRALLVSGKGAAKRASWATMPQPLWVDGARVSVQGFNYTPSVSVRGPNGETIKEADLNLQLFPPGGEDSFAVPGLPHRFWVRLYPDATLRQSARGRRRVESRGYQLKRPLLHLAVTRGKRLVHHGWLRPGETLGFDGFRIAFPGIRRGGEITVHRDRGYPILWAALLLALAGLLLRLLVPSCKIWLLRDATGGTQAIWRDDPFGRGRAERLVETWRRDGT